VESLEIPQNPVPCQSEIARAGESHCLEVNMKLVRNLWFMQYRPGVNEYPNILPGVNFWDTLGGLGYFIGIPRYLGL